MMQEHASNFMAARAPLGARAEGGQAAELLNFSLQQQRPLAPCIYHQPARPPRCEHA